MPRIDPLLSALMSNRADTVSLSDGDIAHLTKGGARHPLTRQPLGEGQLLLLLREMCPSDVAARLEADETLDFVYANADGRFLARVVRQAGRLTATVSPAQAGTPGPNANGTARVGTDAPPGADTDAPPRMNDRVAPEVAESVPAVQATERTPVRAAEVDVRASSAARVEIERLLNALVSAGASDLHLRAGEPPIMRVDGELKRTENLRPLTGAMLETMLVSIMPERNQTEFRDTNDTDFAHAIDGVARFRGNAFRDHHGAGAVFRVVPATVVTAEQLGISPEVQNLCYLTKGLVLVTGPTGSGKSTTLGGLIDLINRTRNDHVITIEDPIEFVHQSKRCLITQRQVGVHTGSFKAALRAALREDPDIVLVGELRDLETIHIALETAETGHLVFGTLHTTTAVGTIDRIIDQFPADRQSQIRVMLADTLKGVISQTLCKKVGGGRVAAMEILLSLPSVSNLIREGKAFQIPSVMQTSRKLGMILLSDVLIDLVDRGIVEPREAYIKATDKGTFLNLLKSRGHELSSLGAA